MFSSMRGKIMRRRLTYQAVLIFTIISLFVSPVFVQAQQAATPASTAQNASAATPPVRQVTLGMEYSSGKKWYPNPLSPYTPLQIAEPALSNSQRVAQLIQGGKLMLSLDDAISL